MKNYIFIRKISKIHIQYSSMNFHGTKCKKYTVNILAVNESDII